jgi:hypothetical protein
MTLLPRGHQATHRVDLLPKGLLELVGSLAVPLDRQQVQDEHQAVVHADAPGHVAVHTRTYRHTHTHTQCVRIAWETAQIGLEALGEGSEEMQGSCVAEC